MNKYSPFAKAFGKGPKGAASRGPPFWDKNCTGRPLCVRPHCKGTFHCKASVFVLVCLLFVVSARFTFCLRCMHTPPRSVSLRSGNLAWTHLRPKPILRHLCFPLHQFLLNHQRLLLLLAIKSICCVLRFVGHFGHALHRYFHAHSRHNTHTLPV